jgi:hypothetical protein
MRSMLRFELVLLSLLWAPLGCGRKDQVEAAASTASGAVQVVAEVDGRRITLAELDERLAAQLSPLEQQVYDLRAEGLRELIGEVLLEKEAGARGVSVEALLAAEVDAKVGSASAQQVAQIYEANRSRLAGVSAEQAYLQIESAIRAAVLGREASGVPAGADQEGRRADEPEPPRSRSWSPRRPCPGAGRRQGDDRGVHRLPVPSIATAPRRPSRG